MTTLFVIDFKREGEIFITGIILSAGAFKTSINNKEIDEIDEN